MLRTVLVMHEKTQHRENTRDDVVHTDTSSNADNEKKPSIVMECIRIAVIALIIVVPIRTFIAQPFIVQGASMEPAFHNGEYLIIDQVTYRFEEPKRGDVVIFRYPRDPSKFFIKRIIALPGETIAIEDGVVTITSDQYPEGLLLDETYVTFMGPGTQLELTVPEDGYFVMGDNRSQSSDSRTWGALPRDHLVGRAFLRLLPVHEADVLPGHM